MIFTLISHLFFRCNRENTNMNSSQSTSNITKNCIHCKLRNSNENSLYCAMCSLHLFCIKCKTNMPLKSKNVNIVSNRRCKECNALCFIKDCNNAKIDDNSMKKLLKSNEGNLSVNIDKDYCNQHNEIVEGTCGHLITKGEAVMCYDHCIKCVSK